MIRLKPRKTPEQATELTLPEPLVRYAEKWGIAPAEYGKEILDSAARRIEGKERSPDGPN